MGEDEVGVGIRRLVPAGLVDAGLASLATFVSGAYAAATLPPDTLGAYALFVASFFLAAIIPSQLILIPIELVALGKPRDERAQILRRSLLLGAVPAAASVGVVWMTSLFLPSGVPASSVLGLLLSVSVVTFLSPLQDHVRRVLHLAGRSWYAAVMSFVQVTVTAAVMTALVRLDVQPVSIVFGGLAIANAASLATGIVLAGPGLRVPSRERLDVRALVRIGGWLVAVGVLPAGSTLLASHLIAQLAGAETLGYAEAARIVAQPLVVLAIGISAVTGPLSMESARNRRLDLARRIQRPFVFAMVGAALLYAVVVGWGAEWNPLTRVFGAAYEIRGLVAATVLANVAILVSFPYRHELIAGRREVDLTKFEALGAAIQVLATVATAMAVESFSKPLGSFLYAVAIWFGFRGCRGRMYVDHGASS